VFRPAHTSKLNLPLINIGIADTVGQASTSHPGAPAVVVAAARALNRAGGLHGHPLGVVWCNTKDDPNLSMSCARQFTEKHVAAVIGGQDINDQLSQPILQAANIPWIAMNPISNVMYSAPNVFIPQVPSLVSYQAMTGYAHRRGFEPFVPVVQDNTGGRSLFATVNETYKQAGGSFASDPIFMSPLAADFAPYAATVDRYKPAAVFAMISTRLWSGLLNSLSSNGSFVRALFTAPAFPLSAIHALGPLADKVITPQTYPPYSDPRMAVFMRQLKAEQARGDLSVATDVIAPNDVNGWIGMQVLIAITRGMKDITGPNVLNALKKSGPIKVTPFLTWNPQAKGPANFTNISNTSVYFVGFKNGQQVLLTQKPVTLAQVLSGKF
jgi:ABC-type branched-subunit amino acid transport system substrate-binding protein